MGWIAAALILVQDGDAERLKRLEEKVAKQQEEIDLGVFAEVISGEVSSRG